jgi:hypothetical protein
MRLVDRIASVPAAERELPVMEEQLELLYVLARMRSQVVVSVPSTRGEAEVELRRLWAS